MKTGQDQSAIQRQPLEEEDELMMKPDTQQIGLEGGKVPPKVESTIKSARGGGKSLESTVQQEMSETMDVHLSEAVTGQVTAQEALDRTYDDWVRIIDDYGKEDLLKLYQESIGYTPQ